MAQRNDKHSCAVKDLLERFPVGILVFFVRAQFLVDLNPLLTLLMRVLFEVHVQSIAHCQLEHVECQHSLEPGFHVAQK